MAAWILKYDDAVRKQLKAVGPNAAKSIVHYLEDHIQGCADPRAHGKALTGPLKGLWRYRVGDYRIICRLEDAVVTVLVLEIGHRSSIYK